MKKSLLSLIMILSGFICSYAYTLDYSVIFGNTGEGLPPEKMMIVRMNSDGTCTVIAYGINSIGQVGGYYDIQSPYPVEPGCSGIRVIFNLEIDGRDVTEYGYLIWPTQEGLYLDFNGNFLRKLAPNY